MRDRISRLWPEWRTSAKRLEQQKPSFGNRQIKNVCLKHRVKPSTARFKEVLDLHWFWLSLSSSSSPSSSPSHTNHRHRHHIHHYHHLRYYHYLYLYHYHEHYLTLIIIAFNIVNLISFVIFVFIIITENHRDRKSRGLSCYVRSKDEGFLYIALKTCFRLNGVI